MTLHDITDNEELHNSLGDIDSAIKDRSDLLEELKRLVKATDNLHSMFGKWIRIESSIKLIQQIEGKEDGS